MNGYTKLFGSLIHSTVWREAPHVKIVWVTMLAMVNQDGIVEAAVPGLADAARVTVEEAEEALAKFLSPDPYSRTKTAEGRRIEVVDGGWRLINHPAYKYKLSAEERRERDAERKRQARARQKASAERPLSADCPRTSAIVRDVSHTDQIRSDPKAESRERAPVVPSDEQKLRDFIRSCSKLSDLDFADLAEQCMTLHLSKGTPIAALQQAIREANNKSERAEQRHVRHGRVVAFIAKARVSQQDSGKRYQEFKTEKTVPIDATKQAQLAAKVAGIGRGGS